MIDLTPIIQTVIALICALITYKLIPWIKARTTEAQQTNIRALIKTLVFAAEQIYGAGYGSDKLKYVKDYLAAHGYNVDVNEIEAAVAQYLNIDRIIQPNPDDTAIGSAENDDLK